MPSRYGPKNLWLLQCWNSLFGDFWAWFWKVRMTGVLHWLLRISMQSHSTVHAVVCKYAERTAGRLHQRLYIRVVASAHCWNWGKMGTQGVHMKGVVPWLVRWARRGSFVSNARRAGKAVVPGHLSLSVCLWTAPQWMYIIVRKPTECLPRGGREQGIVVHERVQIISIWLCLRVSWWKLEVRERGGGGGIVTVNVWVYIHTVNSVPTLTRNSKNRKY